MKLNDKQINRLIRLIFDELKGQNMVSFKEDENKVKARATDIVKQNMRDEEAIDAKVNSMMDDLERQHGGEFQT